MDVLRGLQTFAHHNFEAVTEFLHLEARLVLLPHLGPASQGPVLRFWGSDLIGTEFECAGLRGLGLQAFGAGLGLITAANAALSNTLC